MIARDSTVDYTGFKALVNEDTLLRTHCCPWCFLRCANWGTFVADTKCFWTKSETFLCPGHKICVRNKCCARGQTGKHLCRQQCVRNNVSSFARAFSCFIKSILKSLVILALWLALNSAIYSRIALSFALNRIFFSANENETIKQNQSDLMLF